MMENGWNWSSREACLGVDCTGSRLYLVLIICIRFKGKF